MNTRYLLAFALVAGASALACSSGSNSDLGGNGDMGGNSPSTNTPAPGGQDPTQNPGSDPSNPSPDPGSPATTPTVPTNSAAGKALFIKTVFTSLGTTCGTCHNTTGPGPAWMLKADVEGTYKVVFQRGYVVANSILLTKGVHAGAGPALTTEQAGNVSAWIAQELKDSGGKSTPAVLTKIGACFDRTKFDAIGLQNLRTTRRTANNNTNNLNPWNENANNCTGCDNATCNTCHTADDATGFVMSIGSNILPADNTFEKSKLQPFISKYIGVSPTGDPVASNGLKAQSDLTMKTTANSHPMYTLPANVQTALDAFVTDAVTKYKAGTCGQ